MIEITQTRISFLAILVLLPLLLSNNAHAVLCDSGGPSKESCAIGAGDPGNQVSLRNISDTTNMTKSATMSLDKSSYHAGDTATLHITDHYANLTSYTIDKINATIISSSDHTGIPVVLTETGPNTSIFVTTFSLTSGSSSGNALHITPSNTISVKYIPVPQYAPRFQATFDNAGGAGDAILSDLRLTSDDEINTPMSTVIEAVNFTLANGASIDPGTGVIHVVFSYANTELGCPIATCSPTLLDVFIEPPASGTFRGIVQDFGEPVTVDTLAQTVTADINVGTSGGGQTSGSWKIVLAFASGSPGGGGGGPVIHPSSLVIDALAGFQIGSSGPSSPTLLYSTAPFSGLSKYVTPNADVLMPIIDKSVTFPLVIDGKGFALNKYSNKIQTNIFQVGKPFDVDLNFLKSIYPIQHVAIFTDLKHDFDEISNSDTYVTYDKNSPLEIHDPQGFFSKVNVSDNATDKYSSFHYYFTFTKPMNTSDLIVRVWDTDRHSQDFKILNAWKIIPSPENQIHNINKTSDNETSLALAHSLNNTQPQMIYNNSDKLEIIKEWSGYSANSISDEQFLKSIGMSGSHIPYWVMKTSRLLINGDIDQDEFIKSITYLYENNIIKQ
jgi:hypothetical protein